MIMALGVLKDSITRWFTKQEWFVKGYDFLNEWYSNTAFGKKLLEVTHDKFTVGWFVFCAVVLFVVLIVIISAICKGSKKRVSFYFGNEVVADGKIKKGETVAYPTIPEDLVASFSGEWFKDSECTEIVNVEEAYDGKTKKFYAGIISEEEKELKEKEKNRAESEDKKSEVVETHLFEPTVVELEDTSKMTLGEMYDGLRYAMLAYERPGMYGKRGILKKEIFAEMFEKGERVYLYLAIDPSFMIEKGYKVEANEDPDFRVVPCKKVVATEADYEEALELIKETMILNDLVKSDYPNAKLVVSDQQTRKNGFVFYVKNDECSTTASEYYSILRGTVLNYTLLPNNDLSRSLEGKMILKIYKKDDVIKIYFALDAQRENIEFVGFDKNFQDTPAMLTIKGAEDMIKAKNLIAKLMNRFCMVKNVKYEEVLNDDAVERNCGFGYRIRF